MERPADIDIVKVDTSGPLRKLWINRAGERYEKFPWHITLFGMYFTKSGDFFPNGVVYHSERP